jgi:hypothetical protein
LVCASYRLWFGLVVGVRPLKRCEALRQGFATAHKHAMRSIVL